MHLRRWRKQVTYAIGFITIIALLIGGVTLLIIQPEPPQFTTPTPTPQFQPIAVEQVAVVSHEQTVDVVARLHNPNARAGVASYQVTFILHDAAGQELQRISRESYLLPGSLQYIAALAIPVTQPIVKVTLETPDNPQFTELPASVALPSFSTFVRERTTRRIGPTTIEEQKGVVRNTGTLDWQRVEVITVAFDANSTIVGVGTTFIGRLTVGEQREFTVQWPAPPVATERVVTFATTNIFKDDNVIRAIGDPSQLR